MRIGFYLLLYCVVFGLFGSTNIQQETPPPIVVGMKLNAIDDKFYGFIGCRFFCNEDGNPDTFNFCMISRGLPPDVKNLKITVGNESGLILAVDTIYITE